ncbi:MAG: aspartate dehydrogenase [Candidatus Firestonebacteria bacterium]|nr:aspartate dehydrogenase [Candidatus Firestonebacteria bacterium]
MKKIRAGIVGCGTIGREIGKAIFSSIKDIELISVSEANEENLNTFNRFLNMEFKSVTIPELISLVDIVIESASSEISYEVAFKTLSSSKNVMIMSVGGLMEGFPKLYELAQKNGVKLYIPSGAISGLDGLKAASCSKIYSVELTTTKPPKGLLGAPHLVKNNININNITEKTCVFEGNAQEAVNAFPKNINVALTLSLAGIGRERTKIKIIADPECKTNIHEIQAKGSFGSFYIRNENEPAPGNPKTSYLAILSAVSMLKNMTNPVQIGS